MWVCGYVGMWYESVFGDVGRTDGRTDVSFFVTKRLKGQRTEQSGLGIRANVGSL